MKNFKSKLENFWYYHKGATILTTIFVLSLMLLISLHEENLPQDGNVSVVTSNYLSTKEISFDDLIDGKITDLNGDGICSLAVNEYVIASGTDSNSQSNISQVIASFSSGETGLYIFDKANLDLFMTYDAFRPLDSFLPKEILDGRREAVKDGEAFAVNLSGLGLAEKYEFSTDELYAAVIFDRPDTDTDEKTKQLAANSAVLLLEILK